MRLKPTLIYVSIGLLLALNFSPVAMAEVDEEATSETMTRIMMMPPEAEVTGMYVDAKGNFFVHAMHPDEDNYKATIGVINGIDWNNLPETVPELHHQAVQKTSGMELELLTGTIKSFCKQVMPSLRVVLQEEYILQKTEIKSYSARNLTTTHLFLSTPMELTVTSTRRGKIGLQASAN